ncbi:MAG: Maf family protein [Neisseria sp.]|nr:Maf family protein [Neisseria sp.]
MNAPLLYLASASPRRREILQNLGYRVERIAADIDETPLAQEDAAEYVQRLAAEKNAAARAVWLAAGKPEPAAPVLAADTSVALDGRILGKPESPERAREMLLALSGRRHQVHTAVCLYYQGRRFHVLNTNHVTFKTLTEAEIAAYIRSREPLDKAGAYGIQGLGGIFVRELSGSFTGVMGLPVFETCGLLQQAGYAVPPFV